MDAKDYAHFVLQVAVILIAAKAVGHIFRRYLKQPAVLGYVVAGMVIGPFALGGIWLPGLGPLFKPIKDSAVAVSSEIHSLTLLGAVVLLFTAGLETNIEKFVRYSAAGLSTAIGGAAVSFGLGAGLVVWLNLADAYTSPAAIMMGTVAMATSVGLTAAVLSELRRMDSPEGATIFSAAVIDDVLGIVVLAIAINFARPGSEGVNWHAVLSLLGKVAIFGVVTVTIGLVASRSIGRFLKFFGGPGAMATVALALALFLAALSEKSGLAMIIGAYIMGLALSRLDMTHELQHRLGTIYELLVPIFFCVSGMMVDVTSLGAHALTFGLVYTAACIVGKVVGSGIGAWPMGFNLRGALRIGLGMTPRQEVALIVATVALTHGIIGRDLYSAAILMAFLTAIITPPALKGLFDNRSGLRRAEKEAERPTARLPVRLPGPEVAALVADRMARAFRQEEFFVHRLEGLQLYEMRKDRITVLLKAEDAALEFSTHPDNLQYVRFIVLEEMIALREVFPDASQLVETDSLQRTLLGRGEGLQAIEAEA